MFNKKAKMMREIVEAHLDQVNVLLENILEDTNKSEYNDTAKEIIRNYKSQKLALEYVLRDFEKYGA